MKNLVRAFVVALALTGAAASIHTPSASAQVNTARLSAMPVPTCPPNDPNACGMAR